MHYLLYRCHGPIPLIHILGTAKSWDSRLKPILKINYFSQQQKKFLELS